MRTWRLRAWHQTESERLIRDLSEKRFLDLQLHPLRRRGLLRLNPYHALTPCCCCFLHFLCREANEADVEASVQRRNSYYS